MGTRLRFSFPNIRLYPREIRVAGLKFPQNDNPPPIPTRMKTRTPTDAPAQARARPRFSIVCHRFRAAAFSALAAACALCVGAGTANASAAADGRDVLTLSWPTRSASAPPPATDDTASIAIRSPLFQEALKNFPERAIVSLALAQLPSAGLGIDSATVARLRPFADARYAQIEQDPAFSRAPSALAYCFSLARPTHGLARLYRPSADTDGATPAIIFLHGDGGSFVWYQHQLAEWFPDHLILAPAYGTRPHDLPLAYLRESIAAAEKRLGHPLARPTLIGLSAGGFAAQRVYVSAPAAFSRVISLGAHLAPDVLSRLRRGNDLRFIAGGREHYVESGEHRQLLRRAYDAGARVTSRTIPGADHFFLLSHADATREILAPWLTR